MCYSVVTLFKGLGAYLENCVTLYKLFLSKCHLSFRFNLQSMLTSSALPPWKNINYYKYAAEVQYSYKQNSLEILSKISTAYWLNS